MTKGKVADVSSIKTLRDGLRNAYAECYQKQSWTLQDLISSGDPFYFDDNGYCSECAEFILDSYGNMGVEGVYIDLQDSDLLISVYDENSDLLGIVRAWYSEGHFDFEIE